MVSFRGGDLPSPTGTSGHLGSDIEVTGTEIRKPSTSIMIIMSLRFQLYTGDSGDLFFAKSPNPNTLES